jgi:hypothetical protein
MSPSGFRPKGRRSRIAFGKSSEGRFIAGPTVALAVIFAGLGLGNSCGPESFHGAEKDAGAEADRPGTGGTGDLGGNSGANGQDGSRDVPKDTPQDLASNEAGIDVGASDAPPGACPGTILDKVTPCNGEPPCTKGCGLNLASINIARATKLCTCPGVGQTWQCPNLGACTYPPLDVTCFNLPTPLAPCPVAQVEVGSGLIMPNATACTLPAGDICGNVCGSSSSNSYQDSGGNGKIGYCACVTKGASAAWQCASINEWPPEVTQSDGG